MNGNYKIGDRVVCVDDRDSENLFAGYEYKIVDINQYGNIQVAEDECEALPHFYRPSRFDVAATGQNTKKNAVKNEIKTFDPTKKYQTRDGKEFRFIGMSKEKMFPVVGEYLERDGSWQLSSWNLEGKYLANHCNSADLVEVSDKIEIEVGGVTFEIFDDQSILINGSVSSYSLSDDEIDALIDALKTFRS